MIDRETKPPRRRMFRPSAGDQRKECLRDWLIILIAGKAGQPVLTAKRNEFALLRQVPGVGMSGCF